ncbi:CRISPR-associated RAMP protein [Candidatus Poribacteria bacterium]|nr:CRISPR-associated RAMP protein [Candidatus Poribacteria bacterium]
MFHQFSSRLTLSGTLMAKTALRIGAGRAITPIEPDLPVVKDSLGRPYIPGSTFKGVLRSYVESIVRSANPDRRFACDTNNENEWCITKEEIKKLKDATPDDKTLTDEILKRLCMVCQLFGSPWIASKVQTRDLYVLEETWFGQYQDRDGVAIDRDTETSSEGKLYDYQVVPAGVVFQFSATVDNAESWQLGMLYVGLSAFERQKLTVGGGASRGLGLVELKLNEQYYLFGEEELLKSIEDEHYPGKPATNLREGWVKEFLKKLSR